MKLNFFSDEFLREKITKLYIENGRIIFSAQFFVVE